MKLGSRLQQITLKTPSGLYLWAASPCYAVARLSLFDQHNGKFHQASVAANGLPPNSQTYGYSLGVLHHVPKIAAFSRSTP